MRLHFAILLFATGSLSFIWAKNNQLSKIIVTSKRATCKKTTAAPHAFIFNYLDNVIVTFADQSTIKADMLEIIFETSTPKKNNPPAGEKNTSNGLAHHLKKIEFNNNVRIKNNQHSIRADKGLFNIMENTCLLEGNVTIEQAKTKKSDIPVTVQSNRATFNLSTMETTLEGSDMQPVHTCFMIENNELHNKRSHPLPQGHHPS